jgi:hypothetical protein
VLNFLSGALDMRDDLPCHVIWERLVCFKDSPQATQGQKGKLPEAPRSSPCFCHYVRGQSLMFPGLVIVGKEKGDRSIYRAWTGCGPK